MTTLTVKASVSVDVSLVPLSALPPVPVAVTVTLTVTDWFELTLGGVYVADEPDPLIDPPPETTDQTELRLS